MKIAGVKEPKYMNVNGAYAFWKDVKIPVLHVLDHQNPLLYLPFLITMGAVIINGPPYILFAMLSGFISV